MADQPEPEAQTTALAAQLKAQNEKALDLKDDPMSRMEAAFGDVTLKPATPQGVSPEAIAPAAQPKKDAAPEAPATEPKAPAKDPAKTGLATRLMNKPEPKTKSDKTVEKADDKDFTPPEGLQEESSKRFQKLVNRAKTAETWRSEYEPKVKEWEPLVKTLQEENAKLKSALPPKFKDQIDALTKERDALDAIVKRKAIEEHPQFKAAFDEKIDRLIQSAKNVVPGKQHQRLVETMLNSEDPAEAQEAYEKIVEEIGPFAANQLTPIKVRYSELKADRAKELENAQANAAAVAKVEQQQALEAEQMTTQQRDQAIRKTIEEMTGPDSDLFVFRKIDGEDDWNKTVDQSLTEFQRFAVKALTPADQVELAKRAASSIGAHVLIADMAKQLDAMAKELDGIRQATPGFRGGGGGKAEIEPPKNEGYADRLIRIAQAEGAM